MELPLVNESQDHNSNPDVRVRGLSGERPLVVKIRRVIGTSCIALVIQRTSCLWVMLFGLSYPVSWNSWWKNCIYIHCAWVRSQRLWSDMVLAGYAYTSKSLCTGPCFGTEANWHQTVCISTVFSLQNMVAESKLQWSLDYASSWIAPWNYLGDC